MGLTEETAALVLTIISAQKSPIDDLMNEISCVIFKGEEWQSESVGHHKGICGKEAEDDLAKKALKNNEMNICLVSFIYDAHKLSAISTER